MAGREHALARIAGAAAAVLASLAGAAGCAGEDEETARTVTDVETRTETRTVTQTVTETVDRNGSTPTMRSRRASAGNFLRFDGNGDRVLPPIRCGKGEPSSASGTTARS